MAIITFTFAWILALNALFLQLVRSGSDSDELYRYVCVYMKNLESTEKIYKQGAEKSGKDKLESILGEEVVTSMRHAWTSLAKMESLLNSWQNMQERGGVWDRLRFVFQRKASAAEAAEMGRMLEQLRTAKENYHQYETRRLRAEQQEALVHQSSVIQEQDLLLQQQGSRLDAMEQFLRHLQPIEQDDDAQEVNETLTDNDNLGSGSQGTQEE